MGQIRSEEGHLAGGGHGVELVGPWCVSQGHFREFIFNQKVQFLAVQNSSIGDLVNN